MSADRFIFRTTSRLGYRLARIQHQLRIKSFFNRAELFEFRFAELYAHLVDFFMPYTMLTGDGASDLYAQLENFCSKIFCPLQLTRIIRIIENQWMKVTVTGMKHIGNWQIINFREFADPG